MYMHKYVIIQSLQKDSAHFILKYLLMDGSMVQVVHAVGGKIPVLIDGGVRRGTDVFKAVALGARAVLVW